jgi:hypothetical protein
MHASKSAFRGWIATLALLGVGCGPTQAPIIEPLGDQTAVVGVELALTLRARDPRGGTVTFSFAAPDLPDLKSRPMPATLQSFADGVAIFRWTPMAGDSNARHPIDFRAASGRASSVETVQVTVKDSVGVGPIFREPAGSGTTIDLDKEKCKDVPIVVQDDAATQVSIAEELPRIDGAQLMSTAPFEALWHWCPTQAQAQASSVYQLRLSADDGQNPKVQKTPPYLIVLRSSTKGNCPGDAPTVQHTPPGPQATVQDLVVKATISDDVGLKGPPLLYWSTTAPGSPPDVTKMTPVAMVAEPGGTTMAATYDGTIPNPVAASPAGTVKTVYYLFVVRDNDDPTGGCDHTTQLPPSPPGAFTIAVTNPGMQAGAALCAPCTHDVQCAGPSGACLTIGMGSFCSRGCGDALAACPTGYTCSTGNTVSVDGAQARACLPASGLCGMVPNTLCTNDRLEANDSRTGIVNATSKDLPPGAYPDLIMCPPSATVVDEDWYGITVAQDAKVSVNIDGPTGPDKSDIDLELVDGAGGLLAFSGSLTNTESVSYCVFGAAGKQVFAHVTTFDLMPKPAPYALNVTLAATNCSCADALDPSNSAAQAVDLGRPLSPAAKTYSSLRICTGEDDWFAVTLNAADKIVVDLTFTQTTAAQDLDVHFYAPDGTTDLTPCPPVTSCMINNGQSSHSNEHFEWTIPAGQGGKYFVVVRGYNGGANTYDFAAKVCPNGVC